MDAKGYLERLDKTLGVHDKTLECDGVGWERVSQPSVWHRKQVEGGGFQICSSIFEEVLMKHVAALVKDIQ